MPKERVINGVTYLDYQEEIEAKLRGQLYVDNQGEYFAYLDNRNLRRHPMVLRPRQTDPWTITYQTIGGNWEKYPFSVDRLMERERMFVKEIVIEQDNGPTLIATGPLANTMSRGKLFGKGHIVSWGNEQIEREKILYYTGVDRRQYPNVGTIGHCDWSPYRIEGLYEPLTPLREAIRAVNTGK